MSDYPTTAFDDLPLFAPKAPPQDRQRLNGQCQRILAMLRGGPCTNDELSRLALKHTSRISDLRAAGYSITRERLAGGVTRYTLKG